MMHVGNPATLKKHPGLFVKYFRGWIKAHKLLKKNPGECARVCHPYFLKLGAKVNLDVVKVIVRRLRSEVFLTDEVKNYLNDMANKQQVKLGWIKRHPDFTKVKNMDDSILRKIAKEMNYKAGLN